MIYIIDRIRDHGGEVIRNGWDLTLRRGRLTDDGVKWVVANKDRLMREVWPEFDAFQERAAALVAEGMAEPDAKATAYAEVMRSRC